MTHVDLFSGIGGFALAARWAGIKTVQFVEIDKFCHKVLNKNFPGVPIHEDIKTFHYSGARPFILTGGFPCQPFSCAGKRKGKDDDRFLWPEMLRVVSEVKPRWIIGENVAGFIDMGLDDCISDLENQGYEVQTFIIPACALNAPHRRDRVWIVANSRRERTQCLPANDKNKKQWPERRTEYNGKDSHVSYPESIGLQGSIEAHRNQRPEPDDQQLHGCRGNWGEPWIEAATKLCRVDARVSNRVDRLKSLGNAIVPQIAYQIMKAIVEVENR